MMLRAILISLYNMLYHIITAAWVFTHRNMAPQQPQQNCWIWFRPFSGWTYENKYTHVYGSWTTLAAKGQQETWQKILTTHMVLAFEFFNRKLCSRKNHPKGCNWTTYMQIIQADIESWSRHEAVTDWQTDRQTDKQTDRYTDRQTKPTKELFAIYRKSNHIS